MTNDDTSNSASSSRERQFDEIIAELMRTIDEGGSVDRDMWLRQHSEFNADLKEFFAKHERLEKLVRPLRQAAANVLHVRCPHCHNPIELLDQAPLSDISCPSCGSSFSLVGDQTLSHDPRMKSLGHFELLDRVGMGQFGSVWKARDTKLDRTVAIKIPRNGRMESAQTEMFLRDARAAAQLKHSNIVSVHEVGKQDDTVYIVSDFIQGATLKEWTDAKRLTPRESAELCIKIAQALHHAHEAGVIHRDLKPSNIMMDAHGDPHLVDFGLAKRDAGEITMTVEGQILGTPAYMSPEQARGDGHKADRRADIYSFGVILFELLTGELPFRGDKQMLLVQILKDDPPSPRKLNSSVPRDLETICLKCLEKEPNKRYSSSGDVADELTRFLSSQPIVARPISSVGRIWRWCKRNPMVTALSASLTLLLLVVSLTAPIVAVIQANLRKRAEDLVVEKDRLLHKNSALILDLNASLVKEKEATAETTRQTELVQRGNFNLFLRHVEQIWRSDPIGACKLLEDEERCPPNLRDFTWGYFHRLSHHPFKSLGDDGSVWEVALSPDGTTMACASSNNTVSLWDIESQQRIDTLKGHSDETLEGRARGVRAVAFSSDGTMLASGDRNGTIILWDTKTRQAKKTLSHSSSGVYSVAFSPSGRLLASSHSDTTIILWNINTGTVEETLRGHTRQVLSVAFSSDGKILASASWDGTARLWNVTDAQVVHVLPGNYLVRSVALSDDGATLASTDDGTMRLWDTKTGRLLRVQTMDALLVHSCAFSPDGAMVATADHDGKVALWEVDSGRRICTLISNKHVALSVAFSLNGRILVSGGTGGSVNIWSLEQIPTEVSSFKKGESPAIPSAKTSNLSPDGKTRAISKPDGSVKLLDAVTGHERATVKPPGPKIRQIYFSADGKSLVAQLIDGSTQVWQAEALNQSLDRSGEPN